jgi:hypothetical protein
VDDKHLIFPEQRSENPRGNKEPLRSEGDARFAPAPAERGSDNRGHRPAVTKAGEVTGSGAGAGGSGAPEDFDSDPVAGGGKTETLASPKPEVGQENSNT